MKEKRKIDIWPTIASISLILMVGVFVFSYSNSSGFKNKIKELKHDKDSLEIVLNNRQHQIDSITQLISNMIVFDTIQFKEDVENKIAKKYKTEIDIIYINNRNENIELLREFLKQRENEKKVFD